MHLTENVIRQKIKDIISDNFDNEYDESKNFDENGINSVTYIKIIVAVEKELQFQFQFEDFEPERFSSVSSFIDYVIEITQENSELC